MEGHSICIMLVNKHIGLVLLCMFEVSEDEGKAVAVEMKSKKIHLSTAYKMSACKIR